MCRMLNKTHCVVIAAATAPPPPPAAAPFDPPSVLLLMLLLMLLRNETGDDLPRFDLSSRSRPPLLLAVTRTIGELAAVGQSFTTDESLRDKIGTQNHIIITNKKLNVKFTLQTLIDLNIIKPTNIPNEYTHLYSFIH